MGRLAGFRELLGFDNRWQLIAERILFRGTHLQIYRINGLEMIVDHRASDAGSIRGCIVGDMYRRFLSQMNLKRDLTVADFGANAGGFACLLKVLGLEVRRLMCVELNPNTYERLRFNICTNFEHQPVVLNAAVCGTTREISLSLGVGSTSDNIYLGHRGTQSTSTRVIQGRTFDELCETHLPGGVIDICKMDIEGAEAEVLSDSSTAIKSLDRCRYLLIEMHPVDRYSEMCRVLERRGFKLLSSEGKTKCGVHLFQNARLA